MKTWWMGLAVCALVVAPGAAMAGNDTQAKTTQASMVVTGSIVIKPDGSVATYALDHADKLPAGAKAEMARAVPQWKFQPFMRDGKAVQAKSPMSVRLVAMPANNGNYSITVSSAYFGKCAPGTCLRWNKHTPPQYPAAMRHIRPAHMNGPVHIATVYLAVRVGRDGAVQRVAIQRVNLGIRNSDATMQRWRHDFATACLAVAKDWSLHVPAKGPDAGKNHWTFVTSATFNVGMYPQSPPRAANYGKWQAYIPGPKHLIPWMDQNLLADNAADAIPAGGAIHSTRQTLHLLSSLGGH